MKRVCKNAWGQYMRCRENASTESNKRAKMLQAPLKVHPLLIVKKPKNDLANAAEDLLEAMKHYRPKGVSLKQYFSF